MPYIVSVEKVGSNPTSHPMKDTDIAWIAGLFEGEGSITIVNNVVRVTIQMTDLDILQRVQDVFGGRIYSCSKQVDHHKDSWKWTITSTKEALEFIQLIYPYLGNRRKTKADEALVKGQNVRSIKVEHLKRKVFALRSYGMTHKDIAGQLGYDRSYITKILNTQE